MSFLGRITGAGVTSVIDSSTGLVKTVFGSKADKENNMHSENVAVHDQHAAEYQYRGDRNVFDSLTDMANRLVRPLFTYGILALFYWAATSVDGSFLNFTARMGTIPDAMWIVLGTVIAFWFGSRSIFKDRMQFKQNTKYIKEVYKTVEDVKKIQKSEEDIALEKSYGLPNSTIDIFKVDKKSNNESNN